MASPSYITRDMHDPRSKPKLWLCTPEADMQLLKGISDTILNVLDCAIYYESEPLDEKELIFHLEEMQLFILPVTDTLINTTNRVVSTEFPFALSHHIPILPIMLDNTLTEEFNEIFGELQFISPHQKDNTAIPFEKKLKDHLDSIFVNDGLAEKIRAAFDTYIFLSYRKKDREHAKSLMRLIHENDFCRDVAIWYDEFLTPGENFNDSISKALDKSELLALAVTPNVACEDNYVTSVELPMASQLNKTILPVEMQKTDEALLRSKFNGMPPTVSRTALSDALLSALKGLALRKNRDPLHNFLIGLAYLYGIDVETDRARGVELITDSASAGLCPAMEKLSEMYVLGNGVEKSYEAALFWRKKLVLKQRRIYKKSGNANDGRDFAKSLEKLCKLYNKFPNTARQFKKYAAEAASVMKSIYAKTGGYEDADLLIYLLARYALAEEFSHTYTNISINSRTEKEHNSRISRAYATYLGILRYMLELIDTLLKTEADTKRRIELLDNAKYAASHINKYFPTLGEPLLSLYLPQLEPLLYKRRTEEPNADSIEKYADCLSECGYLAEQQEDYENAEMYFRKEYEERKALAELTGLYNHVDAPYSTAKCLAEVLRQLGRNEEADAFQKLHDDYENAFLDRAMSRFFNF